MESGDSGRRLGNWLDTILDLSAQASYRYQTRLAVAEEAKSHSRTHFSDIDRFQKVADRASMALFRLQDAVDRIEREQIADSTLIQLRSKVVDLGRAHLSALLTANKLKQEAVKETLRKSLGAADAGQKLSE